MGKRKVEDSTLNKKPGMVVVERLRMLGLRPAWGPISCPKLKNQINICTHLQDAAQVGLKANSIAT